MTRRNRPWICPVCRREEPDTHRRFERRTEYRSLATQSRYKVTKRPDDELCKDCVDAEVGEVRPRKGLLSNPQSMLDLLQGTA